MGLSPLLVPQENPGPMRRTVTDAALMFDAMVGYDDEDAYTATAVLASKPEGGSYAANLGSKSMRHARLGVLRKQMLGAYWDPDCAAVNAVINNALDTLKSSGTQLVNVDITDMEKNIFFTLNFGSRSRNDLDNFLAQRPHIKRNSMAEIQAAGLHHKGLDLIHLTAESPAHPHQDPDYHFTPGRARQVPEAAHRHPGKAPARRLRVPRLQDRGPKARRHIEAKMVTDGLPN